MKPTKKIHLIEPTDSLMPQPRRSSRAHKPPKNDDFFMGTSPMEEMLGSNYFEEDYYPKRRRKNNRYDDSDDYSDGHRHHRKHPQPHLNQVEALLEWKKSPSALPITVNYLPEKENFVPIEELHQLKKTKNVATENLLSLCEDIQAIFINIEWGQPGQTMKQFQLLKLESSRLMPRGLVFVWAPKEYISQLLTVMERKDFVYVQNLEIVKLDFSKAVEYVETTKKMKVQEGCDIWPVVKQLDSVSPCDLIANEPSEYFNRSKQTLLMFKKNNNQKFELRHQRTCDVVFDMPVKLSGKCAPDIKGYIYNMIQTLLPDCLTVFQKSKTEFGFKMLELWGDHEQPRRGWVTVAQE